MQRIASLALVLLAACATAPPPAVDEQTRRAIPALEEALAKDPANVPYTYLLASYYDKAHDAANVVKWLTRLDALGWDQGVAPYDFRNTKTRASRSIAAMLRRQTASRESRRADLHTRESSPSPTTNTRSTSPTFAA